MTRIEEAKELRKQGLSAKEIAQKMNIKLSTTYQYIYWKPEHQLGHRRYEKKRLGIKVRSIIRKELSEFGLPLEWEDELVKMFVVYHYSDQGRLRGGQTETDVRSLIQLLCRRYRVPTPRKLEILTYQGAGARRKSSGYMDVLKIVNGITASHPIDYVKYFITHENLPEEEISQAQELIKKIPMVNLQSRSPRVLATAVLYEIHKPSSPRVQKSRIYTQRYIADQLQVSEIALRKNWIEFFKDK